MTAAWRMARRELRGGLAGFWIFLLCLALGVGAIAAVGSVRAAIDRGLAREAAALLGGDAEIEFTYRFADPPERAWMDANATEVSEIVDFRSMAAPAGGDPAAAAGRPGPGGGGAGHRRRAGLGTRQVRLKGGYFAR